MIKSTIIKWKTRQNFKKRLPKSRVDLKDAKTVAILYSKEFEESKGLKKVVADLESMGIKVKTMLCLISPKESSESPFCNERDFSLLGNSKKEELSFFTAESYDFAISLDNSLSYLLNYVFSMIECRCRVGNFHPDRSAFLELMIQCQNTDLTVEEEILRYLKLTNT